MKRIAFVVESNFMSRHHGVRSLILGLKEILGQECRVDLISFFVSPGGRIQFYRLSPKNSEFVRNNGICIDTCWEGPPQLVYSRYAIHQSHQRHATPDDFYYSHIGTNLAIENYDLCLITNPWLVEFDLPLPAKATAGIVYDVIPNTYVLNNDQKPFQFAAQHCRGFEYFRRHCHSIFGISPAAANDFSTYFAPNDARVVSLPPVMPASFASVATTSDIRPHNVVLAAPFDRRKGLLQMPDILNAAADEIDTLFIYGGVRCEEKDVQDFFHKLRVKRVAWWPNASADIVHRVFHESKVLLFPSLEEGLGLPILEAQFCGCRVMIRNQAPMNKLSLTGSEFMSSDAIHDGEVLKSMIVSDFPHAELQQESKAEFDSRFVRDTFFESLGWNSKQRVLPLSRAA